MLTLGGQARGVTQAEMGSFLPNPGKQGLGQATPQARDPAHLPGFTLTPNLLGNLTVQSLDFS